MTMEELWVPTTTHGRVLVQAGSADWLVGFHGYGESAERSFEQLALVPGAATWTVAAIEALHRFYDKRGEVIASWMTRRGREQAIRDNRAYVVSCLDSIAAQTGEVPRRLGVMGSRRGRRWRPAPRVPSLKRHVSPPRWPRSSPSAGIWRPRSVLTTCEASVRFSSLAAIKIPGMTNRNLAPTKPACRPLAFRFEHFAMPEDTSRPTNSVPPWDRC